MKDVRLAFVGDILVHTRLLSKSKHRGSYSFRGNFEEVRELLSGSDLSGANLESIAAGEKYGISGYPKFNAPQEILGDLRQAGFSVLSVANNHMLDKGEEALIDSLQAISSEGMHAVGASVGEAPEPPGLIREVNGLKIGFLAALHS